MKRMAAISALLLLLTAAALAVPQGSPQTSTIRNFLRVNEQICTGGQPTLEELEKLKAEGIRAVINLRQASEFDAAAEAAKAKELGLRYVHIPVAPGDPKPEQAAAFLRATDDPANRPAFIHCGTANRVGAFWMIRRVLRDGWSPEKAEAEARKIGLRSPNLVAFAREYIARHKSGN